MSTPKPNQKQYYAYPNWRMANTSAAYPPISKNPGNPPIMFPPGEIESDNIDKYVEVKDKGWTLKNGP